MKNGKRKSQGARYFDHRSTVVFAMFVALTACKKEEEKDPRSKFTNCKLPIADGRGGVAIGGFPGYPDRLKSSGTAHATVIMVDFPDAPASITPEEALAKIEGASAVFDEMSYGRFDYKLNPTLQWYRMSQASSEYTLSDYASHIAYVKEAVSLADNDVDFSSTDSLVIIANPEAINFSKIGPSMALSAGQGVSADGKEMLNIVTSGQDLSDWGAIWLNHEVTHTLGLVDLYAYEGTSGSELLRYTGMFSYMGYNSFESNAPALLAWERWVLGWLDDDQINCANPFADGDVNDQVTPISQATGLKAVIVPFSETSALVVESRRASGLDKNLVKPGALVYLVDSSLQSGYGPVKVFPSSEDDPYFLQATLSAGESVEVDGLKIEVTESTDSGDSIRLSEIK